MRSKEKVCWLAIRSRVHHLPPNTSHNDYDTPYWCRLCSPRRLRPYFFTASFLLCPHIVGNPAIHRTALALVSYEVDFQHSDPAPSVGYCYMCPAPLSSTEFDCRGYSSCYFMMILFHHSSPPLNIFAPRTGSSHKAEQVFLRSNRPFTAMQLIIWASMHESRVPQNRP